MDGNTEAVALCQFDRLSTTITGQASPLQRSDVAKQVGNALAEFRAAAGVDRNKGWPDIGQVALSGKKGTGVTAKGSARKRSSKNFDH